MIRKANKTPPKETIAERVKIGRQSERIKKTKSRKIKKTLSIKINEEVE